MAIAILYLLMFANAAAAVVFPWIGIIAAYLIAIMAPHYIWWWLFEDLRPYYWVIVPTLIGFAIAVIRHQIKTSMFATRLCFLVLMLWIFSGLSYYFGAYVDVVNEWRFYDPELMFSVFEKTLLSFFVGVALINDSKKLKYAALVIVVTTIYMTYWANAQYFIFHKFGRLHGPTSLTGAGIYNDENNFAVLFVTGFPFVYYFGVYLKKPLLRLGCALIVPLAWHATFLTASRGALLGIGGVLLMYFLRLEKKAAGVLVIAGFLAAFAWQAGDVMKSRSATITSYQEENSANERLEAWQASMGMMAAHPLLGVGFASFGQAFSDFSDKRPRVAHNTFFQIGGEWGPLAGITYLVLIFSTIYRLRKNGTRLRMMEATEDNHLFKCINESCLLALTGFFVCSMFLSLQGYEVFYYLLLLANATLVCSGYHASLIPKRIARRRSSRPGVAANAIPDASSASKLEQHA